MLLEQAQFQESNGGRATPVGQEMTKLWLIEWNMLYHAFLDSICYAMLLLLFRAAPLFREWRRRNSSIFRSLYLRISSKDNV